MNSRPTSCPPPPLPSPPAPIGPEPPSLPPRPPPERWRQRSAAAEYASRGTACSLPSGLLALAGAGFAGSGALAGTGFTGSGFFASGLGSSGFLASALGGSGGFASGFGSGGFGFSGTWTVGSSAAAGFGSGLGSGGFASWGGSAFGGGAGGSTDPPDRSAPGAPGGTRPPSALGSVSSTVYATIGSGRMPTRPATKTAAASTSAWPSAERPTMRVKRSSHSGASWSGREAGMRLPPPLRRRLGHQPDARQPGVVYRAHDAHHLAVGHGLIGAHVELAVGPRARDGGELGRQLLGRHRRVVQEELSRLPDVHHQLLLLARQRAGGDLRQVDRDALLEDGRGHHEDDEQH